MTYAYIPRSELEHDLASICEGLPEPAAKILTTTVKALIVRVAGQSMQGQPLVGNLHDCFKIKLDLPEASRHLFPDSDGDPAPRWRLVYRVVKADLRDGTVQERLDILSVGRRGEAAAYRIAAKRLRRAN